MSETTPTKPHSQSVQNTLTLPDFESISATTIVADIECLLEAYQQCLDSLENIAADELSWGSLVMPELAISLQLDEYWSPVSHLNHVADNEELRDAYDKAREKITAFFASRGQNHKLYQRCQQLKDGPSFQQLDALQQRIIQHELRDFKLSGAAATGSGLVICVGLIGETQEKLKRNSRETQGQASNRTIPVFTTSES
ncbi:MAG: hypothetical protein L3J24_13050 [Xanthomonadales bacterium]|nr:hypothetical protein [Xanthomonadales bacterium]